MTTNRYPWYQNTTPNTADQDDPRYETPGGAANKIEQALEDAKEYTDAELITYVAQTENLADDSVTRPKISPGAVGATELDPSLLDYTTDIAVAAKFNEVDAQLANFMNYEFKLSDFGGHAAEEPGYESFNNYTAIMAALTALDAKGGGTLKFPIGTIQTSPFSFQGLKSIELKGNGRYLPWEHNTTIKFITSGDVGIQFADTTFPTPVWSATHCKISDIYIDGNNMVNYCVNGNYDLTLEGVCARHAILDGIKCEDLTFPVTMYKCESSYNGRNGLYVRGHLTTKYTIDDCEFSNNEGYAMWIEGGASSTFSNLRFQSNKKGGIKLNYTAGSYLENLVFINCYWENNGTIGVGNPGYEGDYALVIASYNQTSSTLNKARNVRFIGGALNASASGKTYLIESVYALNFDGIATDHSKGSLPYPAACASMLTSVGASSADNAVQAPYPFITSYGLNTNKNVPFHYYKGGIMGARGRTMMLTFYVPSITAGSTVNMSVPLNGITGLTGLPQGFPLLQDSTVLATELYKQIGFGSGGRHGTLTAQLVYNFISDGATPTNVLAAFPAVTLDIATTNRTRVQYTPLQVNLDTSYMIGVRLTASADYTPGSDTPVVFYILLEN